MRPEEWRRFAELAAEFEPLKWRVYPLAGRHILDLNWIHAPEYGFLLFAGLTKAGLLGNLRQCKRCSKWFPATKRKKNFCTADCQSAFWEEYRRTEAGRKEMAVYMSWLRRQRKQKSKTRRMKR
jgi:hypothetical protein